MLLAKYEKQPVEVKDVDVDYASWLAELGGDTLDVVTTTVQCLSTPTNTSLVVDKAQLTQTLVKVWLSGGTTGERYKLEVTVTTVGGRVDQSELIFSIRER